MAKLPSLSKLMDIHRRKRETLKKVGLFLLYEIYYYFYGRDFSV